MIYGLPEDEARWVKKNAGEPARKPVRSVRPSPVPPLSQAAIAYATSGVPARSGTTAGSGTVTLYYLNGSTLTAYTNEDGNSVTVTAYNLSASAVASSTYIHVKREFLSGQWLVDFEDCG